MKRLPLQAALRLLPRFLAQMCILKDRIKALLDDIDPTVDTSAYERYKDSESIDELTAIGIAVKKLHDTQGAK
jgi:hypothetical protein